MARNLKESLKNYIDVSIDWLKDHLKIIALGVIILFIYGFLIYTYKYYFVENASYTKTTSLFKSPNDEFFTSFRASFLEDLAFFLILGILIPLLTTLITYTSPDRQPFNVRVRALMNRKSLQSNDNIYFFLHSHLEKILGFYESLRIDLTLEEFNDEDKKHQCYLVFGKMDYLLVNMCRDHDFKPLNELTIEPDTEMKGDWGFVSTIGTYNASDMTEIDVKYDNARQKLLKEPLHVDLNMNTPKNSQIKMKMYFGLWNKIEDNINPDPNKDYYLATTRYVKKVDIFINNKIAQNKKIKCNIVHSDRENKIKQTIATGEFLYYNQHNTFPNTIEMYPEDKIRVYFYPPESL